MSFRGYSLYWEYGNYFPRWSQWMFWGLIIYVSSCNSQQIPVNTGLHMKAWIHHFPELLARMTWVWGEHIHILSFICGRGICAGFLNLTWPLTTSDSFVFSSARELQRWNIHFSSSFFFLFFTSRIQNLLQPLAHDLTLCTLYLGPLTAVADTEWHALDNIHCNPSPDLLTFRWPSMSFGSGMLGTNNLQWLQLINIFIINLKNENRKTQCCTIKLLKSQRILL